MMTRKDNPGWFGAMRRRLAGHSQSQLPKRNPQRRLSLRVQQLERRDLLAVIPVGPGESIQAAIDLAASLPGDDEVLIAPGTYQENLTINDSSGALRVRGTGTSRSDVIIDGQFLAETARVTLTNNVKIDNLTMINGAGVAGLYIEGRTDIPLAGIELETIRVEDSLADGVFLQGNTATLDVNFTDVTADTNGANGVRVENVTGLVLLRGIQADFNRLAGLYVSSVDGPVEMEVIEVENNSRDGVLIENVGSVLGQKILANGHYKNGVVITGVDGDVTLTELEASDNRGKGLAISQIAGDVTVTYAVTNDNGHEGIEISFAPSDVRLDFIEANGNKEEGIDVSDSGAVRITNFVANFNGNREIIGGSDLASGVLVVRSDSVFLRDGMSSKNTDGGVRVLDIAGFVDVIRVEALFTDTDDDGIGDGISLKRTGDVFIDEVIVKDSGRHGIQISDGGRVLIQDSILDNNPVDDIFLSNNGNVSIRNISNNSDGSDGFDLTLPLGIPTEAEGETGAVGQPITWEVDEPGFVDEMAVHALSRGEFDLHLANENLWQNPLDPLDSNHDGVVTSLDALIIINAIWRDGARNLATPLSADEVPDSYLDSNGDHVVSPNDVLRVLNELNSRPRPAGEGESADALLGSGLGGPLVSVAADAPLSTSGSTPATPADDAAVDVSIFATVTNEDELAASVFQPRSTRDSALLELLDSPTDDEQGLVDGLGS